MWYVCLDDAGFLKLIWDILCVCYGAVLPRNLYDRITTNKI